ncbi:MAG: type IX secretion system protein PorQ [Chitinophagales bacterium]|nr:type IX secretion system protein PorQ [Chitinophagales bacterium]
MKKVLIFLFVINTAYAQVGGMSTFQFLDMPVSARAAAQGGVYNHIYDTEDAGLAIGNPAMLQKGMHKHISMSYLPYFAGSHYANASYVHSFNFATFQFGAQFMNYGKQERYDEYGNSQGTFGASDVALVVGAGRSFFSDKLKFGANVKLAYSQIESYNAMGMAFDLAGMYVDTAKNFSASLIVKNVGFLMKTYVKGKGQEMMPTDVQFGISKRFKHLPFRINITAHNFTRWDLIDDNGVANDNQTGSIFGEEDKKPKKGVVFLDNMMRHIIIGGEFEFGRVFSLGFAYNHHRRQELKFPNKAGLSGFSFGAGLHIKRVDIQYSFAKYTVAGSANQFTLNLNLGEQIKHRKPQKKEKPAKEEKSSNKTTEK